MFAVCSGSPDLAPQHGRSKQLLSTGNILQEVLPEGTGLTREFWTVLKIRKRRQPVSESVYVEVDKDCGKRNLVGSVQMLG